MTLFLHNPQLLMWIDRDDSSRNSLLHVGQRFGVQICEIVGSSGSGGSGGSGSSDKSGGGSSGGSVSSDKSGGSSGGSGSSGLAGEVFIHISGLADINGSHGLVVEVVVMLESDLVLLHKIP